MLQLRWLVLLTTRLQLRSGRRHDLTFHRCIVLPVAPPKTTVAQSEKVVAQHNYFGPSYTPPCQSTSASLVVSDEPRAHGRGHGGRWRTCGERHGRYLHVSVDCRIAGSTARTSSSRCTRTATRVMRGSNCSTMGRNSTRRCQRLSSNGSCVILAYNTRNIAINTYV
jgi:hypothetical protein